MKTHILLQSRRLLTVVFLLLLFLVLPSSLTSAAEAAPRTYITWQSLEPDKWASVWLIRRHLDPEAKIEVRPVGSDLTGGIAFGAPGAHYRRSANLSAFESLLQSKAVKDSALHEMGRIITLIETTSWSLANTPSAHVTERHFRRLQDRFGRQYVPVSCYSGFFDALYRGIQDRLGEKELSASLHRAVKSQHCDSMQEQQVKQIKAKRVTELSVEQLLAELAENRKVVFVDTREPQEFDELHIPGAINIPMRDLNPEVYERLKQADRVISYCVKDFRGYEVARKMLHNGVHTVAVMKPHGLAGWKSKGLPLVDTTLAAAKNSGAAGTLQTIEQQAVKALQACARDTASCSAVSP